MGRARQHYRGSTELVHMELLSMQCLDMQLQSILPCQDRCSTFVAAKLHLLMQH